MSARARLALIVAIVPLLSGCGDIGPLAKRYKAQRLAFWAAREEAAARLGGREPDSTTLLAVADRYRRVAREIRPPYLEGSSERAKKLGYELISIVGNAELQAARLAVQARRPEAALERMKVVAAFAADDTLLRRRADFFRLETLRQMKRTEEAIALMKEMLRRYPPQVSRGRGQEDAILAVPEAIVMLRRESGDEKAAKQALDEAAAYYRNLLSRENPPTLQAQIYARLVRVGLEQGDWSGGLGNLEKLMALAAATPELKNLEPEIRYSEAKLQATRIGERDPQRVIALFDRVAKEYPRTTFAAHALFDAGALLERRGRLKEALDRYRQVAADYADQEDIAPVALFRRAVLEERSGDWERAKNLLESIPPRYPESQAAIEAPMAVARRYFRVRDTEAARAALRRAVVTYRSLIARDTTSSYVPIYRWAVVRCQLDLGDWKDALETVDETARRDLGHPFAAQSLLDGAKAARSHGQIPRARGYLERFLSSYPRSPLIPAVRRELAALSAQAGRPG